MRGDLSQPNVEMMSASQNGGGLSTILRAQGGGQEKRSGAEMLTHVSCLWWIPWPWPLVLALASQWH
jgi:hypothetical protein